jgi:LCP family protein required for cell wall assembly
MLDGMSDQRDEWNDGRGGSNPGWDAEAARSMPTIGRGQAQPQYRRQAPAPGGGAGNGGYGGYGASYAPTQGAGTGTGAEAPLPPELNPRGRAAGRAANRAAAGGTGGPAGGAPLSAGSRPRRRRVKIRHVALGLVGALVAVAAGTYFWADSKLNHSDVLASYAGEPATGKGTNWLIVGSDSRQGLTQQQMDQLHTGYDTGARTDSMMILHMGSNGDTLMSIPRDSYVTIPAFTDANGVQHAQAKHKINASFAEGGGQLLARTLELNTGIHIDHYAEIGFSGFVNLTNALGGVNICLDKAIVDKASGANFKAGCQTMNGAQALAFVRERHQEATQDLARMQHQQQFLSAIAHQAATPATVLNPFVLYPTIDSGVSMLTVDNNTGLWDLGQMFFAMKDVSGGNGKSMTVPIADANYYTSSDGDAVLWNTGKANQVFDAFKNDTAVPSFSN